MKRVRITHPVLGVIVTAMIGMGCLGAAPASRPTGRRDIIRPGDGVGPVSLGMSESELDDAMGKPATMPWGQSPKTQRDYLDKDMTVLLSKAEPRKAGVILAGRAYGIADVVPVGTFPWR